MRDPYDLSHLGATPAENKNQGMKKKKPDEDEYDLSHLGATPAENKTQEMSPLQAEGQYLKGIGKGTLEKLGKFGASAANAPSDIYEHFAGEPLYEHINNPYQPKAPESEYEASGQRMGPGAAELLALAPPLKIASMMPSAARGAGMLSKMLSTGGKIGTAGAAGYAEGLLIGEPNRQEEAKNLGMQSAGGEAIGLAMGKVINSMPSKKIAEAQKNFEMALARHEENKALLDVAKGQAGVHSGVSSVERFIPNIELRNNQIKDAISTLSDLPDEPFPSMVTHEAYKQLPIVAQDNLTNVNRNISQMMGAGNNPDKPLAKSVTRYFEGVEAPGSKEKVGGLKQQIGEEFNGVRRGLEGKKFTLPANIGEGEEYALAKHTAESMVSKKGDATPQDVEKLTQDILKQMGGPKGKTVDAASYFDRYRSLDQEIGDETYYLRKNQGRLTTDEIKAQKKKIVDMQTKFKDMEDFISKNSPPETIEKLNRAKFRWGNEYAPLRSDPDYRKMVNDGIVDGDLMQKIRGDDKASLILRNHFQTNPNSAELLGNYQFANKPEALQSLTPYEQEFINPKLTPKISALMNEQKVATDNVMRAKSQEQHFDDLMKNIQSEHKRHVSQLEERQKLERQIPQWEKEISDLEKHEKIIREKMKNVKLSKSEMDANKEQLAKITARRGKLGKFFKRSATFGLMYELMKANKNPH